jgi:molybdenum cofactor cytidylyltransferase
MFPKKSTAGIILAAGMSKRFGRTKQLLKLDSKYLIELVLDAALDSRLSKVVLVLGHEHQRIMQALGPKIDRPRLQVVINRRYRRGQSQSLQAGLSAVYQHFHSAMFLLGDQPRLRPVVIDHLLECFWKSQKSICVPVYRGIRGNPTIFRRSMYCKLMAIEGDVGARNVIRENPHCVLNVELDNPACFKDIDLPADYRELRQAS